MSSLLSAITCNILVLGIKPGGHEKCVNAPFTTKGSAYSALNKNGEKRRQYNTGDNSVFEVSDKLCNQFQRMYKIMESKLGLTNEFLTNRFICHSNLFHFRFGDCKKFNSSKIKKDASKLSIEFWTEMLPQMKNLKCILLVGSRKEYVKHLKKILCKCHYDLTKECSGRVYQSNYSWYIFDAGFQDITLKVIVVPHLSYYPLFGVANGRPKDTPNRKNVRQFLIKSICQSAMPIKLTKPAKKS